MEALVEAGLGFYNGITNITNITSVIAVAGANVAMILFGWAQERMNPRGRTTRTTMVPFWFGTMAGIARGSPSRCRSPGPGLRLRDRDRAVLHFRIQPVVQYRGIGRWTDYVYGQQAYLVLSLAAKSLLAWQIYVPSLDS